MKYDGKPQTKKDISQYFHIRRYLLVT